MSTWEQVRIACPRCGTPFEVQVASGLHITRLPHVRERVLRGELHRFVCPSCDRRIEVRQPVLYTDFERMHWIEVRPADELPRWPELAAACASLAESALMHGAPMICAVASRFRVRLVFGYDELREKLLLWDAGIDDVAVELLKLRALRADLTLQGPEDRLLGCEVTAGRELRLVRRRYDATASDGNDVMLALPDVDALASLRARLEEALGGPFPDPFVSVSRLVGRFAAGDHGGS